jgi:plastocyanin
MKKRLLVLLMVMAVVITACGQSGATDEKGILSTAEFTVVATDIVYDTTQLEVKAGQSVHITFRNEGVLVHDLTIATLPLDGEVFSTAAGGEQDGHGHDEMGDALAVHVAAAINGGSNVLQFTPTEPGTYEYYCTVEGHKEAGMVGKLVVTAP